MEDKSSGNIQEKNKEIKLLKELQQRDRESLNFERASE